MTARACASSTAGGVPLSAYLGVLGMPSFTAWYGIKHICKPKAGETVFVSAATGAVGQVAGQLAKLAGARVVGCAGDEDKCVWAVREAGYDACFNHRTERDYGAVLDKLCPKGIDADFENVGGKLFHAVFERLNNFGRVAFCGAISEYQDTDPMAGPPKMFSIVQKRLTLQGFIVSDHVALMGDFVNDVAPLLPSGQLKSRETVVDGLSKAPAGLHGPAQGRELRQAGGEGGIALRASLSERLGRCRLLWSALSLLRQPQRREARVALAFDEQQDRALLLRLQLGRRSR